VAATAPTEEADLLAEAEAAAAGEFEAGFASRPPRPAPFALALRARTVEATEDEATEARSSTSPLQSLTVAVAVLAATVVVPSKPLLLLQLLLPP